MADYVPVADVKKKLLECPVCHEEYDDGHRIPRRMPCCFQSVCQPCLEEWMRHGGHLSCTCPHCRHQHHLPDGVSTLPKEHLIIRMLDFLKIQKGISFPCTNCPEKKPAVARCDDCGRFICQGCLDLHRKLAVLKEHKPVTFEEMRELPAERLNTVHKCSKHKNQIFQFYCQTCSEVICTGCTVVDHKNHDIISIEDAHTDKADNVIEKIAQVKAKEENLKSLVLGLKKKKNEIESSWKIAKSETNKKFQGLIEQLQKRRDAHLDDIDDQSQRMMSEIDVALDENIMLLTRLQSSREYITEMRAKVDAIEDINLITSSMKPLQDMLDQTQQDVTYERTGVAFVPANVDYLDQCIKTTGLVRSVTFTPTTDGHPERYDVAMSPASFPQGPVNDATISIGENTLTCPRIEWDTSTGSTDVNIAGSTVSNMEPDSSVHNTGCRFQQAPLVKSIRPLVVTDDQQMLLSMKMTFTTKKVFPANTFMFEIALTPTPVDTTYGQPNGVSVQVATSGKDSGKQFYLEIGHNKNLRCITPVCVNQAGASGNITLLLLLGGSSGVVSVVDVNENVRGDFRRDNFDDPMWFLVNLGSFSNAEVKCEVVAAERINLSEKTKRILSKLNRTQYRPQLY